MSGNQAKEPSYYEIALTNRQVVVAFVLILGSILASFLSGVWLGRQGGGSALAGESGPQKATDTAELEKLEDFRFFADGSGDPQEVRKPDLSKLLDEPQTDSTLAEDVGGKAAPLSAEEKAERRRQRQEKRRLAEEQAAAGGDDTPPPSSPPPRPPEPAKKPDVAKAPPAAAQETAPKAEPPPPPAPPAKAPPAAAEPQDGLVIQVFSTRDEPQARKVLGQLQGGGFQAYLSPVEVEGQTMYRVRIGPFVERAAADQAAQKVNQQFKLDTWITAAVN